MGHHSGQFATAAASQLRQEDVFKSISENVSGSGDPTPFYAVAIAAVTVVVVLTVVNWINKRRANPRAVNRQGKLVKEILRRVPVRRAEFKQLRVAASEQGCQSPLTLVLCPSLLAKGIQEKG